MAIPDNNNTETTTPAGQPPKETTTKLGLLGWKPYRPGQPSATGVGPTQPDVYRKEDPPYPYKPGEPLKITIRPPPPAPEILKDGDSYSTRGHKDLYPKFTGALYDSISNDALIPLQEGIPKGFGQLVNRFVTGPQANVDSLDTPQKGRLLYLIQEMDSHLDLVDLKRNYNKAWSVWMENLKKSEGYQKLSKYGDKADQFRRLRGMEREMEDYKSGADKRAEEVGSKERVLYEGHPVDRKAYEAAYKVAGARAAYNNRLMGLVDVMTRRTAEVAHLDDFAEMYNFMGSWIPRMVSAISSTDYRNKRYKKDTWGTLWLKDVMLQTTDPKDKSFQIPLPSTLKIWPDFQIDKNGDMSFEKDEKGAFGLKYYSAAGGLDKAGFFKPKTALQRFGYLAVGVGGASQIAKTHTNILTAVGRRHFNKLVSTKGTQAAHDWLYTSAFRWSILKPWQLGKLVPALRNEYRKITEFGDSFVRIYGMRVEDVAAVGFLAGGTIAQENEAIRTTPGLASVVTLGGGPLMLMMPQMMRFTRHGAEYRGGMSDTKMHRMFANLFNPVNQRKLKGLLEEIMPDPSTFMKLDKVTGRPIPLLPAEQAVLLNFHKELHMKSPEARQQVLDDFQRTFDQISVMDPAGQKAMFAALNHFSSSVLIETMKHFYSKGGPYTKGPQRRDLQDVITALETNHAKQETQIYDDLRSALTRHGGDAFLKTRQLVKGVRSVLDDIKAENLAEVNSYVKLLGEITGTTQGKTTKIIRERFINKNYPELAPLLASLREEKWEHSDVIGKRGRQHIQTASETMRRTINSEWYDSPTAKRNFSSEKVFNSLVKTMRSLGEDFDVVLARFAKKYPPQKVERTMGWYLKKARRKADEETIIGSGVLKAFNKRKADEYTKRGLEWVNVTEKGLDGWLKKGQNRFKWGEYGKTSEHMELIDLARKKWAANTKKLGSMPEATFSVENLMIIRSELGRMLDRVQTSAKSTTGATPYAKPFIDMRKAIDKAFKQAKLDGETTKYIGSWRKMANLFYRNLGGKVLALGSGNSYKMTDGEVFSTMFAALKKDPGTVSKIIKDMFPVDADRVAFMRDFNEHGRRVVANNVLANKFSLSATTLNIPDLDVIRSTFVGPQNKTATNAGGEMYTYFPELQAHADNMANQLEKFSSIKGEVENSVQTTFKMLETHKKNLIDKKKSNLDRTYRELYTIVHDTLADNKLNALTNDQVFKKIMEVTDEGGSPQIIQFILESDEIKKAAINNNIDLKKWVRSLVGHKMAEKMGAYLIKSEGKEILSSVGKGSIRDLNPDVIKDLWFGQREILRYVYDKKTFREMDANINFLLDMSKSVARFGAEFPKEPFVVFTVTSLISRAWNVAKGIVSPMFPLLETAPRYMLTNQRLFLTYLFTDPYATKYLFNMAKDPGKYLLEGNIKWLKQGFYVWAANINKIKNNEFPKLEYMSTPKEEKEQVIDEGWKGLTRDIQKFFGKELQQ